MKKHLHEETRTLKKHTHTDINRFAHPCRKFKKVEKLPNRNSYFFYILYKDKCSGNCTKYISCLLLWLEDGHLKETFCVKKNCFCFWPKFWTLKILVLPWKTAKRVSLGEKLGQPGCLMANTINRENPPTNTISNFIFYISSSKVNLIFSELLEIREDILSQPAAD